MDIFLRFSKFLGIISHSQIKNWPSVYVIHSIAIANVDFWIIITKSYHNKGQLILKGNFSVFNSPKKQTWKF